MSVSCTDCRGCANAVQPGDCVMLSAANSTVGQTIIQLCKVLRLRCVAIVRAPEKTKTWLDDLGASVVLGINAHIRVRTPKA